MATSRGALPAAANHGCHATRRPSRTSLNAILGSLLVGVLLSGPSRVGATWAAFTSVESLPPSTVAAARRFAPSDVAAVPIAGGRVALSWSLTSWATRGYSVRRGASPGGPFAEIATVDASTPGYVDGPAGLTDGEPAYYVVRGLSALGGSGLDSSVAGARVDATPPTLVSSSPAEASTSVTVTTTITTTFNEPMNRALTAASFALVPCADNTAACATPGAPLAGTASWQADDMLSFVPTRSLENGAWYGIRLQAGVGGATDVVGNTLSLAGCPRVSGSACLTTFQTQTSGGRNAGGVTASSPPNGATGVATNARISLTFNGPSPKPSAKTALRNGFYLQQTSGASAGCYVRGGTPACPSSGGSFAWSGDTMTFAPSAPLQASSSYAYGDHAAGGAGGVDVWYDATFTTGSGADIARLTVSGTVPGPGAVNVDPATSAEVGFSEATGSSHTATAPATPTSAAPSPSPASPTAGRAAPAVGAATPPAPSATTAPPSPTPSLPPLTPGPSPSPSPASSATPAPAPTAPPVVPTPTRAATTPVPASGA